MRVCPPKVLREVLLLRMLSKGPHFMLLLDLKQGQTILYLIFEYMDTDLKNFIHGHRITMRRSPTTPSRNQELLNSRTILYYTGTIKRLTTCRFASVSVGVTSFSPC